MLLGAKSLPNHAFLGSFETFLRLLDGQFLITLRFRKKRHLRLFFLDCFPRRCARCRNDAVGVESERLVAYFYSLYPRVMASGDKPRGHPCPCAA